MTRRECKHIKNIIHEENMGFVHAAVKSTQPRISQCVLHAVKSLINSGAKIKSILKRSSYVSDAEKTKRNQTELCAWNVLAWKEIDHLRSQKFFQEGVVTNKQSKRKFFIVEHMAYVIDVVREIQKMGNYAAHVKPI